MRSAAWSARSLAPADTGVMIGRACRRSAESSASVAESMHANGLPCSRIATRSGAAGDIFQGTEQLLSAEIWRSADSHGPPTTSRNLQEQHPAPEATCSECAYWETVT